VVYTLSDLEEISILCVDDETLLLEVFQDFFDREPGFSVTTCTNATDALEQLSTRVFDVIIADVQVARTCPEALDGPIFRIQQV